MKSDLIFGDTHHFMNTIKATDAFYLLTTYHSFFSFLIILPFLYNLYCFYFEKNYAKLIKKIWLSTVVIFLFLSISFFLGISAWAMLKFAFQWKIILMLILWLTILIFEIKRNQSAKFAITSEDRIKKYIKYCKYLYCFDIVLFLIVVKIIL